MNFQWPPEQLAFRDEVEAFIRQWLPSFLRMQESRSRGQGRQAGISHPPAVIPANAGIQE